MDSMREHKLAERHWDGGDLLRRLYGLAPEGDASDEHLTMCSECSSRWEELRLARIETLSESSAAVVPEAMLLAQRRALWARVDHPRRFWFSKWAPVAATAMMLVAGFVLLRPTQPLSAPGSQASSAATTSISDAELFGDLSAMASPAAPRAAEPIRGLFENSSSEEEGSF